MSVVLRRRNASVGRAMMLSSASTRDGDDEARIDIDTDTELGRDRSRSRSRCEDGGGGERVIDGYRCMDEAPPPLPDLSTLVWKAAVSGRALGPVDERGRKLEGSALGVLWRPERLGRRLDGDEDEPAAARQRMSSSGDAGGEGSWRDLASEYSPVSASVSSGTGSMERGGLCGTERAWLGVRARLAGVSGLTGLSGL